jgi:hypothetical protein
MANDFSKSDSLARLGQRTYSREDITRLYEAHRKGAYKGRELEWARQERDLYNAQKTGRVRGGITRFDK